MDRKKLVLIFCLLAALGAAVALTHCGNSAGGSNATLSLAIKNVS